MKYFKNSSYCLIFLVFVSCGSLAAINPLKLLTGNSWALSSLSGEGLELNRFSGGIPTLNFLDGGRLAGFTGCNNFSGSFALEGNNIQLDPGAMTKKACQGDGEQDFLDAIAQANELEVDKENLKLMDGDEVLMTFVPK